jgi:hypothetical protein
MDDRCCLTCKQSFSEPGENEEDDERLFCMTCQKYVVEDGVCEKYNG